MRYSTRICLAILSVAVLGTPPVLAQTQPYTLTNAPWALSGTDLERAETCARVPETGLRAYIFPMETERYQFPIHHVQTELIMIPTHRNADGIMVRNKIIERVISGLPKSLTYPKQHVVGYLNDHNEWVNSQGRAITKYDSFHSIQGTPPKRRKRPIPKWSGPTKEAYESAYLSRENRMQYAQACTYMRLPAVYEEYTETIKIQPAKIPLTCAPNGAVVPKNTKVIEKTIRNRTLRADTKILFVDATGKYGSGNMTNFYHADKIEHQGEKCFWEIVKE